ncbi:hypothetical protein CSAG_04872 [Citrobacter portucalensis]|jgi:hypothetical protein|nr:hypothetical protein CSAG_04872 [Citrobacter portucalensis]KMV84879.1 hypothetical protein HMPREF9688_05361 [Klebsiella oxytoca 10-5244]OUE62883.1 hypothetical protein AZ006_004699 [Citrobacter freundii]QAS68336.1 hypothetical protein KOCBH_A00338 [Klebsiella michiganensis]
MSSDAIKMVEAFVKDPLSYDRFGPGLFQIRNVSSTSMGMKCLSMKQLR